MNKKVFIISFLFLFGFCLNGSEARSGKDDIDFFASLSVEQLQQNPDRLQMVMRSLGDREYTQADIQEIMNLFILQEQNDKLQEEVKNITFSQNEKEIFINLVDKELTTIDRFCSKFNEKANDREQINYFLEFFKIIEKAKVLEIAMKCVVSAEQTLIDYRFAMSDPSYKLRKKKLTLFVDSISLAEQSLSPDLFSSVFQARNTMLNIKERVYALPATHLGYDNSLKALCKKLKKLSIKQYTNKKIEEYCQRMYGMALNAISNKRDQNILPALAEDIVNDFDKITNTSKELSLIYNTGRKISSVVIRQDRSKVSSLCQKNNKGVDVFCPWVHEIYEKFIITFKQLNHITFKIKSNVKLIEKLKCEERIKNLPKFLTFNFGSYKYYFPEKLEGQILSEQEKAEKDRYLIVQSVAAFEKIQQQQTAEKERADKIAQELITQETTEKSKNNIQQKQKTKKKKKKSSQSSSAAACAAVMKEQEESDDDAEENAIIMSSVQVPAKETASYTKTVKKWFDHGEAIFADTGYLEERNQDPIKQARRKAFLQKMAYHKDIQKAQEEIIEEHTLPFSADQLLLTKEPYVLPSGQGYALCAPAMKKRAGQDNYEQGQYELYYKNKDGKKYIFHRLFRPLSWKQFSERYTSIAKNKVYFEVSLDDTFEDKQANGNGWEPARGNFIEEHLDNYLKYRQVNNGTEYYIFKD